MVDDILERFGGARKLAKELGLPPTTVFSWKYRGRIPDGHHDKLLEHAQRRGVSLERDDFYRQNAA